jgi:glycerol kinase
LKKSNIAPAAIAAIGLSTQRETTILWNSITGQPIYPAIVWQDRRTTEICKTLSQKKIAADLSHKTGLLLDPYFSGTKVIWILDNVPGARELAEQNKLLFGTVDTYLLWKLTGGKMHVTDATNASRTLLFNIRDQRWDNDILEAFHIPKQILPNVFDNAADFGETIPSLFGVKIRIAGMAGDQQAATIGQTCFEKGEIKVTLGTGGFLLMNTGNTIVTSNKGLLSTITYRLNNQITYGLEGSFFSAGVSVKWLRDTLKVIHTAAETEHLSQHLSDNGGVYLVPAFTGLGTPYWQPEVRAAIFGLTQNKGVNYFARAALESTVYQTRDLLEVMRNSYTSEMCALNVDGGMAENNWLLQFLADILAVPITRPTCIETSALGAAYLAGLQIGLFQTLDHIKKQRQVTKLFKPKMEREYSNKCYEGWKEVVKKLLN